MTLRSCDFCVNQLKSVVDGRLLSKMTNALCNRPLIHGFNRSFAQKKKWAKTHRTTHPKIREEGNYTERIAVKQTQKGPVAASLIHTQLKPGVNKNLWARSNACGSRSGHSPTANST